jgi:uncharacterized secreted protein with C-terminal beta-propeller domain
MHKFLLVAFLAISLLFGYAQNTTAPQWQSGTIIAVAPHTPPSEDPELKDYDVTVRVGPTVYVALYSAPAGTNMAAYRVGANLLVMPEADAITFKDVMGADHRVPILRSEAAAASPRP